MGDNAKNGRGKPSSYPALSLRFCLEKARAMVESQSRPDKYLPAEDFANLAGYKGFDSNSAPKGFIAALGHFGLVEKDPRTRGLRLAQSIRSLAWSERGQREILVSESMVRPSCYQNLLRHFAEAIPNRAAVEAILVEDGMAPRPAKMLAGGFMEDWAMAESLGIDPRRLLSEARDSVHKQEATFAARDELSLPDGGKVDMRFSRKPSQADWKFLEDFCALKSISGTKKKT